MRRILTRILVLFALPILVLGCQSESVGPTEGQLLADATMESPDLEGMASHMESAKLMDRLREDGPYTLFAPTLQAFATLSEEVRELLLTNEEFLKQVLLYHIAIGEYMSGDLENGAELPTLQGQTLKVTIEGDATFINDAKIIGGDVKVENGVIHLIDKLLIPEFDDMLNIVESLKAADDFNTLVRAIEAAGLTRLLSREGPLTLFAPTDEAFEKLHDQGANAYLSSVDRLAAILKYHIVPRRILSEDIEDGMEVETLQGGKLVFGVTDEGWTVNGVKVLRSDWLASNGVIQVIGEVLMPETDRAPKNIVQVLEHAEVFGTLLEALEVAGLTEALATDAPLTLFAPTDEAFEKLPEGLLDDLFEQPDLLAQLLLYHVVPELVTTKDLYGCDELTTVQGGTLTVTSVMENIFVNSAQVIRPGIRASNGIIHVIDGVLIPPDMKT